MLSMSNGSLAEMQRYMRGFTHHRVTSAIPEQEIRP